MRSKRLRRIPRRPEQYDVLSLFASLGRQFELSLTEAGAGSTFSAHVTSAFDSVRANPVMLYGLRTQEMFMYVAASLGKLSIIKAEDTGDIVALHDLSIPDYRLVSLTGEQYLVEVKNCAKIGIDSRFSIRKREADGLLRYGEIMGLPMFLAIYWSRWNAWTMVRMKHLRRRGSRLSISFPDAMMVNEMHLIGDLMLGTTPPLVLRVVADPNEEWAVDPQGNCMFVIGAVEIYCGGRRITKKEEQHLALMMMLYGDWTDADTPAEIVNGDLVHFDIVTAPEYDESEKYGFALVGTLSGIVSRQFNRLTLNERGAVRSISSHVDPGALAIMIDESYESVDLPLWRFHLQPNPTRIGN